MTAVDGAYPVETDRFDRFGDRTVRWLRRTGSGTPILLLGGCGVPYPLWDPVLEHLSDADVIRMDRPGLSGTEWPGVLPRLTEETDTLSQLLKHVNEPVIVAAHSMAGPHAEALARHHPDLVAGVVFVDGSLSWRPRLPNRDKMWQRLARQGGTMANLPAASGLTRFLQRRMMQWQAFSTQPSAVTEPVIGRDAVAMVIAEQAAYARQLWDLSELRTRHPWPAAPATVLTAVARGYPDWVRDQARLARLLDAEHVVLTDAKHLIMLDRPDAIADAIADAIRQLAAGVESDSMPVTVDADSA